MKVIQASQLSDDEFERFINNNEHIQKESLREKGYVVEINDKIFGCFLLEQIKDRTYWLKQLYVIKDEARKLPVLLEVILVLAKEKQAERIYAHSQQPVTDLLLDSFSFSLQKTQEINIDYQNKKGHWWLYRVS